MEWQLLFSVPSPGCFTTFDWFPWPHPLHLTILLLWSMPSVFWQDPNDNNRTGKNKLVVIAPRASLIVKSVKTLPAMQETRVWYLGWEYPLEKEMATHSSILAWRIPWTEQPGGLQSTQSQVSDLANPIALKPWGPIYCQLVLIIWIDNYHNFHTVIEFILLYFICFIL